MRDELERAIYLRENCAGPKKLEKYSSSSWPRRLTSPQINYQCAWVHDLLGREHEAVPFYERAIEEGLTGEDLEGAMLGLGSTYRALGEYQRAVEALRGGTPRFPNNRALCRCFSRWRCTTPENAARLWSCCCGTWRRLPATRGSRLTIEPYYSTQAG